MNTMINIDDSDKNILKSLRGLGKLPENFDGDQLLPLLNSTNSDIRILTLKTIGKLKNIKYLNQSNEIFQKDSNSLVKMEAVSTIGRMRSEETIPYLLKILNDDDPKIVLQAIRGLLPFKNEPEVRNALLSIKNHPNDIVRQVIRIETSPRTKPLADPVKSPDYLKNIAVNCDVIDALSIVPDESIHLTFTSPPYYNARDYSIYRSYEEYLDFLTKVFKEVFRVTKEGRFFILNTSPVIMPRAGRKYASKRYAIPFDMHTRLTEMGWEFIDDIIWLKPEGSSKNRIGGFLQHKKPLGYKPNNITEYLLVYRKQTDRLLDWNMKQYSEDIIEKSKVNDEIDHSNVWKISPANDKIHSAVFPEELCEKVIKYYSYKNDLVFDPFGGSGTFAKVAMQLDRYFFTTEIQKVYFDHIKERLSEIPLNLKLKPEFENYEEFKKSVENAKNKN